MKKNSLLSLALLTLLASGATAASLPQTEPIALPTYVVEASRLQRAEQRVNASLDALRAKAGTPTAVLVELTTLKPQAKYASAGLPSARLGKS